MSVDCAGVVPPPPVGGVGVVPVEEPPLSPPPPPQALSNAALRSGRRVAESARRMRVICKGSSSGRQTLASQHQTATRLRTATSGRLIRRPARTYGKRRPRAILTVAALFRWHPRHRARRKAHPAAAEHAAHEDSPFRRRPSPAPGFLHYTAGRTITRAVACGPAAAPLGLGGMSAMRAALFQAAGRPLAIERVSDPRPAADQILIEVCRAGICGSDLHMSEFGAVPAGTIFGHEFAGT